MRHTICWGSRGRLRRRKKTMPSIGKPRESTGRDGLRKMLRQKLSIRKITGRSCTTSVERHTPFWIRYLWTRSQLQLPPLLKMACQSLFVAASVGRRMVSCWKSKKDATTPFFRSLSTTLLTLSQSLELKVSSRTAEKLGLHFRGFL